MCFVENRDIRGREGRHDGLGAEGACTRLVGANCVPDLPLRLRRCTNMEWAKKSIAAAPALFLSLAFSDCG
jgi:hypothetical protein